MNRSIEFIKSVIDAGRVGDEYERAGWDEAETFNIFDFAKMDVTGGKSEYTFYYPAAKLDDGPEFPLTIVVRYNPDADFQYVSSDICSHDGTLIFMLEAMNRVFNKVASGKSVDVRLIDQIHSDIRNNSLLYEIGDMCVNTQFKESKNPEKPWLMSHQTVALPIKMTLVSNE